MSGRSSPLTVSVVIITAGRRQCLPPCVESLRRQTYRHFEIVVVVGPSKDGSAGYANTLTDAKVLHVDKLNVAYARNAGVRHAAGDVIAFIDDDAVAHPRWLEELVEVFEREGPTCGGAGGYVVNENGHGRPLQALNNTIDDLGEPTELRLAPAGLNDPDGPEFNYFMGANMAFRREAILDAGGFDETYFYLYEDADMSVAVIKAGYKIFHHTRAVVHHFPALSHNRRGNFDLNYFAIARQQLYFALKVSKRPVRACLWAVARTKKIWFQIWAREVREKRMTRRAAARYAGMAAKGIAGGLKEGLRYRREGREMVLTPDLPRPSFRAVEPTPAPLARPPAGRKSLRIALICGEFGGPVFGGVGGYTEHLAEALGAHGHDVTVLRSGHGESRIRPDGYKVVNVPPQGGDVAYRYGFLRELLSLSKRENFDVVEAPLWNGEGAAVGAANRWPLVIRLVTPFEVTRQISGIPLDAGTCSLIAAERLQLTYATGAIGISRAVVDTVEETYGIPMEAHGRRVAVIPLAIPGAGRLTKRPVEARQFGGTRFLFVGRMEARKGVTELGEAFKREAERDPNASLWIVGGDNSDNDGFAARTGGSYRRWLENLWGEEIASRVHFFGKITDEEKNFLFSECDVLVAPSRYESFGIIYLEAMRYGKPTIGTTVGGIPEVVADGVTGLLVPSESPDRLAEAMTRLGSSPELRGRMGAAGFRRFEETFSQYTLGRRSENFYRQVIDDWHGRLDQAPSRHSEPAATVPFHQALKTSAA